MDPSRLNQRAVDDLKTLLSAPEADVNLIMQLMSTSLEKLEGHLHTEIEVESDKVSIDKKTAQTITSSLVGIADLSSTEERKEKFIESLDEKGFTKTEIQKIEAFIKKMKEKSIIQEVSEVIARVQIEDLAFPHYEGLKMFTDYRVMSREGSRKLVPMIIWEVSTHESKLRKSERKKYVFQMTPEELESILSEIQSFNSSAKEEIAFMKGRINN